jgi:hypothetical protein
MGTDTDVLGSERGFRGAGMAGLAGTVLLAVALFLPGAPPRTDEPSREILGFALAHRSMLLLGAYLAALGALGLAWLIAGGWRMLRDSERETLLGAGVASGVIGLVLILSGVVVVSGLVLEAVRARDLALVRIVTDTSNILLQVGLIGLAGFALAASLAGQAKRLLPHWMVSLGVLGAIIVTVTSLPPLLAESGAWQFGGPIALAGSAPLGAWFVSLALLMARGSLQLRERDVVAGVA